MVLAARAFFTTNLPAMFPPGRSGTRRQDGCGSQAPPAPVYAKWMERQPPAIRTSIAAASRGTGSAQAPYMTQKCLRTGMMVPR